MKKLLYNYFTKKLPNIGCTKAAVQKALATARKASVFQKRKSSPSMDGTRATKLDGAQE
jgi:hypothetical protein